MNICSQFKWKINQSVICKVSEEVSEPTIPSAALNCFRLIIRLKILFIPFFTVITVVIVAVVLVLLVQYIIYSSTSIVLMCNLSVDFQVTTGATALFPPESELDQQDSVLVRDTTHYCL